MRSSEALGEVVTPSPKRSSNPPLKRWRGGRYPNPVTEIITHPPKRRTHPQKRLTAPLNWMRRRGHHHAGEDDPLSEEGTVRRGVEKGVGEGASSLSVRGYSFLTTDHIDPSQGSPLSGAFLPEGYPYPGPSRQGDGTSAQCWRPASPSGQPPRFPRCRGCSPSGEYYPFTGVCGSLRSPPQRRL